MTLRAERRHGHDWRSRRLAADPLLNPGRLAYMTNAPIGYHVVRPGVPDFAARTSWHLTWRRAEKVLATWNGLVRVDWQ